MGDLRDDLARLLHDGTCGCAVADDWRRFRILAASAARLLAGREAAAVARLRDLTSRLGFGDGVTEPQADNDTIVRFVDERIMEAQEWAESQRWRDDCHASGHPDDEDCQEHDPRLREAAAVAAVARARALADEWEQKADLYAGHGDGYWGGWRALRRALDGAGDTGMPNMSGPGAAADKSGMDGAGDGPRSPVLEVRSERPTSVVAEPTGDEPPTEPRPSTADIAAVQQAAVTWQPPGPRRSHYSDVLREGGWTDPPPSPPPPGSCGPERSR